MWSQPVTQEQLEERKAKIQSEIKEKEQLLKSVKSKEKTVVTQLQLQKEKIGLKEKLIKTTEKQATILDNDIYSNQKKINLLKRQLKQLKLAFEGKEILRPEFWGGFLIKPVEVEFWQGRPNRLHDRIRYQLQADFSWKIDRLSP